MLPSGMANAVPDSKTPVLVAFGMVVLGIVIAAVGNGGVLHGSLLGGILAAAGALPACFGMWKGIQQETQGTLALSVGAVITSLGAGGVLIVLWVIHVIHH
jgi:hypothetical protein